MGFVCRVLFEESLFGGLGESVKFKNGMGTRFRLREYEVLRTVVWDIIGALILG